MYSKEFPDPPQFKYASSPEQRIQIIEKYQKQNENVAREYLDREDGILFYDEPPSLNEPWAPYPGINEESQKRIERHLNKNGLDMLSVIDI